MFEVLAGFCIDRLIEQQVLRHLFSVWILHCLPLDAHTKKNNWSILAKTNLDTNLYWQQQVFGLQ